MDLLKFHSPGIAHISWLLADGGEAAVVDPRRDLDDYLAAARRLGVQIRYVIETHRQEDFVLGSRGLRELTGAKVVNGVHPTFGRGDLRLEDGEEFELGSLRLRALHTPGHTPESLCWAVYTPGSALAWGVFTGDTLFFGSTGRSDLPGKDQAVENAGLIWDAAQWKLAALGDAALVLPAHGPGSVCGAGMADRPYSSIGLERSCNPVFLQDRDTFAREKGEESRRMPRPPYFTYMERVNLEGGLPPAPPAAALPLLKPDAFAARLGEPLLLDTREPEAFAAAHIPGAQSLWLDGLPVFSGWLAYPGDPLMLCHERDSDLDQAWRHLTRIGHDNVQAVLAGGFSAWRKSRGALTSAGLALPEELDLNTHPQVLDVRDALEFDGGHIPKALHCYVGHLDERLREGSLPLDRQRPLIVTCGVGHRAGVAVALLLRHGFKDVRNLLGGMTRWKALGLPLEKGEG